MALATSNSNATLPALSGFHSRLTFDRDVVNFERFNGDLAGGPFTISGRVTFPKLTQPNLDFQLKAQSILVARNDSLTSRADADVRVTGPWASATVTGLNEAVWSYSYALPVRTLVPVHYWTWIKVHHHWILVERTRYAVHTAVQHWTDAYDNGGGQSATAGNITG